MRKTLLIAAAALAGSVISSQAQVYSQNIVGYINVPLYSGLTAVANQLDFDGTGTNNTVATVFGTNLVANTTVLAWEPSTANFAVATWVSSRGGFNWTGPTNSINAALNSASGVFINSPSTNNLTLVGTVLQGTNDIKLIAGYNFVSSVAPISGSLVTNLGYAPVVNDQVLVWNSPAENYSVYTYVSGRTGNTWSPSAPSINVGQPFFINAATSETWTNVFTSN